MKTIVLGCKDYPAFKHAKDVGGIETFCQDVLPELKDMDFHVFTRKYPGSSSEETIGNVKIHRLPFVNFPLLKTFTFNLAAYFKARKMKADMIWAHEPVAGFFAYFIKKSANIPYILHIHSNGSLEPGNPVRKLGLRFMENFAYKNPKQTIFVSSYIQDKLKKPGIIIPVGINPDKFKSAKIDTTLSFVPGKKICYIGRLSKVKGIDNLILAFSRIQQKDLSLVIVGEGDDKKRLKKLASSFHLDGKAYFLGYKSALNILPYIDVLVLPSYSEGTPHSILEAIACKKPVVATRTGEIPRMITDYLVSPGNVDELASSIKLALQDKKTALLKKEYHLEETVKKIRAHLSV